MGSPRKISEWEESLCIRHVLVQNVAENEKSAFPRSKVLYMYTVLVYYVIPATIARRSSTLPVAAAGIDPTPDPSPELILPAVSQTGSSF